MGQGAISAVGKSAIIRIDWTYLLIVEGCYYADFPKRAQVVGDTSNET
jgi:hypothetical protein